VSAFAPVNTARRFGETMSKNPMTRGARYPRGHRTSQSRNRDIRPAAPGSAPATYGRFRTDLNTRQR
jgi:hypothetical protein